MIVARELIGLLLIIGGLGIGLASTATALFVTSARVGYGRSLRTAVLLIVSGGLTAASWWSLSLLVVLAAVHRSGVRRGLEPVAP